jgi:hypothetical protein
MADEFGLKPMPPVPVTPRYETPRHIPSAFGVTPNLPADYRGAWTEIGRDSPSSNAELARREVAKYTRPTPKGG